jgi:hypothetical protein
MRHHSVASFPRNGFLVVFIQGLADGEKIPICGKNRAVAEDCTKPPYNYGGFA